MPDEQKVLEALSLSPQYESEASDISHEHKYRKVLKWLPVIQFLDELLITKDLDLDADQEITISAAHTAVQNRLQFLKVSRTPFRQRNPRLPLPRSLDRLKPVSAPVPTALPNPSPLRPEGTLSTSLQRFPSHRGLSFPERLDRWADLTKRFCLFRMYYRSHNVFTILLLLLPRISKHSPLVIEKFMMS